MTEHPRIEEIAAREKAASPGPLTRDEIEERRRNLFFFFSEGSGDMKSLYDVRLGEMLAWLATLDDLLAQLKDRDEKLAAVETRCVMASGWQDELARRFAEDILAVLHPKGAE